MSAEAPLWLSEADVAALISLREVIVPLERGLQAEARGAARNMDKTHVSWGAGHTLHALGALCVDDGFAGTKTWAHTGGGATPLLILFDSSKGTLRAIIEAFTLGQMRTGGISAVATRWLADKDADEMAIIGTGKQALTQVVAVAAVRPLKRVRVFSPTPAHRARFVQRLQAVLNCTVVETASVAQAVADAPIITLATRDAAAWQPHQRHRRDHRRTGRVRDRCLPALRRRGRRQRASGAHAVARVHGILRRRRLESGDGSLRGGRRRLRPTGERGSHPVQGDGPGDCGPGVSNRGV
jgi:hypothetical protein